MGPGLEEESLNTWPAESSPPRLALNENSPFATFPRRLTAVWVQKQDTLKDVCDPTVGLAWAASWAEAHSSALAS